MQAFVINLARSTDRRTHIVSELAKTGLDYEIVDAVDGRDVELSDTTLFDPVFITDPRFRPGLAGCALSHARTYRKVLEAGLRCALILEDDVILPGSLNTLADAVAQQVSGAEIVLLNFHSDQPCQITTARSVPLPGAHRIVRALDERQLTSGGGYVITSDACERILEAMFPLRFFADEWGIFYQESTIDSLRCVIPMPITNSTELRTTVDFYRPGGWQSRLREAVASAKLPVLHQALSLRRKRNFRRLGWSGQIEVVDVPQSDQQ